jgi:hypothetical protein
MAMNTSGSSKQVAASEMTDRDYRLLAFANLSRPVAFIDSWPVAEVLLRLLHGWPILPAQSDHAAPAIITVHNDARGYHIECGWSAGARNLADPVDAACALIAELIQALLVEQKTRLCLHSAAVEIDGRLVVFPSDYRAGKSVFVSALAAQGVRVFSDDVLPLKSDRGDGVAPGLPPRLRLPLPDDFGAGTRAFVDRHRGPESGRYLYIDPGDGRLAGFGETAPIGAFVLLEREEGVAAQLIETSAAEVLRRLVLRNFARALPASLILSRLRDLVEGGPRYRLRYARAEEGAELLLRVAKSWSGNKATRARAAFPGAKLQRSARGRDPADPLPLPAAASGSDPESQQTGAVPPGCFLRHPAVCETTVDQEAFLTDPSGWSIHYLNPLGAALWRLFAQPMSVADAAEILHAAFPDRPLSQLAKDVGQWVHQLRAQGFLLAGGDRIVPLGVQPPDLTAR